MQHSFSAEEYFRTQPTPISLVEHVAGVKEFITRQVKEGRDVVLVTVSGYIFHPSALYAVGVSIVKLRNFVSLSAERWHDCSVRAQRVSLRSDANDTQI
jgi:hypothetical protein